MRTVVYDGECPFCRASMRRFRALDWCGHLRLVPRKEAEADLDLPGIDPAASLRMMLTVDGAGKVRGGFYAVRDVLAQLPLTLLPALLMYLPGAHLLGVPVYRHVAANRHTEACDDSCAV